MKPNPVHHQLTRITLTAAAGLTIAAVLAGCAGVPQPSDAAMQPPPPVAPIALVPDFKSAPLRQTQTLKACAGTDEPKLQAQAAADEGNRIILGGRDVTAQAEAYLAAGRALMASAPPDLRAKAAQILQGVAAAGARPVPGSAGTGAIKTATQPVPPNAGSADGPCLVLNLPSDLNAVSQDDTIRVRFVPAKDGSPFDLNSLAVTGSRFGFEKNLRDSIVRSGGRIDASGIEMPMRNIATGQGTVTISVRDAKQRQVTFSSPIKVIG